MLSKAERYDLLIEALQHLRTIEIEEASRESDAEVVAEARAALRELWEAVRRGTDNNEFSISEHMGQFMHPDPDHTRTWFLDIHATLIARSDDPRERPK